MDKKIKAKWVKMLSSGQYVQGTGQLTKLYSKSRTYCCLGVLACASGAKLNKNGNFVLDGHENTGSLFLDPELSLWFEKVFTDCFGTSQ